MMMESGGENSDSRIGLKMPDAMKIIHKSMMRLHLNTVGEITGAITENVLKKASEIARTLGWTPQEKEKCASFGDTTGDEAFFALAESMHRNADEVVESAAKWNKEKAYGTSPVSLKIVTLAMKDSGIRAYNRP